MSEVNGRRAVIYTRVSHDATGEGKSNARQEEDCRLLARLRGWEVVEVCADISISAYSGRARPGWQRVLDLMDAGEVDIVLAWKLDRITRTVRELTSIIELSRAKGVPIATVDGDLDLSNETGKAVAVIVGAIAEMEVERKSARQKRANAQRAAEGKPWLSGWRAFGYELDGTVVEPEAQMIREAAEDVLSGTSLKAVARRWRESGVSTPRSSQGAGGWTHNGVKSILLNPRNAGIRTYRGEVVGRGDWEPIFSDDTYHLLVALLTDRNRLLRHGGSHGRTAENLLTGIARCGTCGETVVAGTSNGTKVYKCPGEHISTNRADADRAVIETMGRWGGTVETPDDDHPDTEGLWRSLAELDERQSQIAESFANGALPGDAWHKANDALAAQRVAIESELAAANATPRSVGAENRANYTGFADRDLTAQRQTLARVTEVTLHSRNRRRNVPMTEQLTMFVSVMTGRKRLPGVGITLKRRSQPDWTLGYGSHPDALAAEAEGRSMRTPPGPGGGPLH